jgi:hypothetical protein
MKKIKFNVVILQNLVLRQAAMTDKLQAKTLRLQIIQNGTNMPQNNLVTTINEMGSLALNRAPNEEKTVTEIKHRLKQETITGLYPYLLYACQQQNSNMILHIANVAKERSTHFDFSQKSTNIERELKDYFAAYAYRGNFEIIKALLLFRIEFDYDHRSGLPKYACSKLPVACNLVKNTIGFIYCIKENLTEKAANLAKEIPEEHHDAIINYFYDGISKDNATMILAYSTIVLTAPVDALPAYDETLPTSSPILLRSKNFYRPVAIPPNPEEKNDINELMTHYIETYRFAEKELKNMAEKHPELKEKILNLMHDNEERDNRPTRLSFT